jgi:hypothetical protein
MKRSDALRSLSRDHHRALTVAQRLRRADDAEEAVAEFLRFWSANGVYHFRVEEEVLLPAWGAMGTVDRDAATRLSREHLEIRTAALELSRQTPPLATIHRLGERLDAHVRFEERELLPLIEKDLETADLELLAAAVREAETAHGA